MLCTCFGTCQYISFLVVCFFLIIIILHAALTETINLTTLRLFWVAKVSLFPTLNVASRVNNNLYSARRMCPKRHAVSYAYNIIAALNRWIKYNHYVDKTCLRKISIKEKKSICRKRQQSTCVRFAAGCTPSRDADLPDLWRIYSYPPKICDHKTRPFSYSYKGST